MKIEVEAQQTEINSLEDLRWYLESCISFWQYEWQSDENTTYEKLVAYKYEEAFQAVYKTCFGQYYNEEA